MLCLHTASTSASASTSATTRMTHTMPSHNDLILRAIEREREALLAKTHAAFSYYEHSPHAELDNVDADDDEDEDDDEYATAPRYDVRGRQAAFRETVRQRQARLEFLRREDAAKRRASRTRKSEETTAMTSLSRSVFYPTTTYSPSTSTSSSTSASDSSSDSDSLAEPESDSDDDEWDAPAPRVRLYVVDEEDEEEEEDDYTFSATAIYSQYYEKSKPLSQLQQPQRQISRTTPTSPRSPVARLPSLESIPECPEA